MVFITPFLFLFYRLILHSSCGVPWRLKLKVEVAWKNILSEVPSLFLSKMMEESQNISRAS